MNEAEVRGEVYRMLKNMGFWPTRGRDAFVCPRCHQKILPPLGRPDLLVLHPSGLNRVVEVKVVNLQRIKSFALARIEPEQRRWLDAWLEAGGQGYLAIGTVGERPRRLWMIDWVGWLGIERTLIDSESLPVDKSLGRFPDAALDLVTLGIMFQCLRQAGEWVIPMGHTLWSRDGKSS